MSTSSQDRVREFHKAFGLRVSALPDPCGANIGLRRALIREEYDEVMAELQYARNLHDAAKELADLLYVVYGTAIEMGADLDAVLAVVHESNMSKLGADGSPVRRADGKILKGPDYFEPDIAAELERQTNGSES